MLPFSVVLSPDESRLYVACAGLNAVAVIDVHARKVEGYVPAERLAELYRGAACLVQSSRYEGFGLPVVEAMASGTPVVAVPDAALVEVAGDAAVVVDEARLADGIRKAVAESERLRAAGLARAAAFSWEGTAEATVRVYLEALAR